MTMEESYVKLQEYLDTLPIGFPKTESGVEIRLLKYLFTPIEAKIALNLSIMPQEPKQILESLKEKGWTLENLSESLISMGKNGAITWNHRIDRNFFSIAPFAIGMFEYQIYQVKKLTKEFLEDCEKFFDEGFTEEFVKSGQLRVIPIEESVRPEHHISTYDELEKFIEQASSTISVAECLCRIGKKILGKECNHALERCFQFGAAAHNIINMKAGRKINKQEALELLRKAQEEGLVIQPSNTQKSWVICCCCGCSCEFLSNVKKLEKPAQFFVSNFYATVDEELCSGCGVCEDRCHMDAIKVQEDKNISHVNLDRCIGCGVCVPTCPDDAVQLVKKENEHIPPKGVIELFTEMDQKKKAMKNQ